VRNRTLASLPKLILSYPNGINLFPSHRGVDFPMVGIPKSQDAQQYEVLVRGMDRP
jgi:hypothetical protein